MPRKISPSPKDLRSASAIELLRYIEEDVAAIRFRLETGKLPAGYEQMPGILISDYATELAKRGY